MNKRWRILPLFIIMVTAMYFLYALFQTFTYDDEKIPILGFHNVVLDDEKEQYHKDNMWVESLSTFEAKMKLLYEEGYHTLTLDELYTWYTGSETIDDKAFVLTFDDGYYSTAHLVEPILEKYGFQASCFVIGSSIEQGAHTWDGSYAQFVNQEDMQKQDIMKYYSHFYDLHYQSEDGFAVDTKTDEELKTDISLASEAVNTDYFAYPYGKSNEQIKKILKDENVKLAFGFNENRKAGRNDDPFALPRFSITAYTTPDILKAMMESR